MSSCVLVTCAGGSLVVVARVVALQSLVLCVAVTACCCHQDRLLLVCKQDKTRGDYQTPTGILSLNINSFQSRRSRSRFVGVTVSENKSVSNRGVIVVYFMVMSSRVFYFENRVWLPSNARGLFFNWN